MKQGSLKRSSVVMPDKDSIRRFEKQKLAMFERHIEEKMLQEMNDPGHLRSLDIKAYEDIYGLTKAKSLVSSAKMLNE